MSASFGKTIRLFLVEGNTNGLITAELSNWTGKAFKIPRIKVKDYETREEFKSPGVYILFGKNEKNEDAAYIGEGEPVIKRIKEHLTKKDFWNEVIIFVSKDKYLNKASIKFLENRLHGISNKVSRYSVDNSNIPALSGVSEAEQAELEEFLSNIKLLTSTLGHKIFEDIEETLDKRGDKELILFCSNTEGITASGSPSTEGFTVFKNSLFTQINHSSLTESLRSEKNKMIDDGSLVLDGKFYKLTKTYIFTSSSRAAAMVFGRSASGPIEWKTSLGISLKNVE
ncbi:GIY-YIG nuclease family protein [Mucilaginibacter sp. Bleaf8]|uniref:GIY-YIG nuclease family protein n=1 Tax=Mucilaginibacter sp. Bleaf8 TaxID=2834430 RepID=UPI001BCEC8C3|nr:GIY-YIG nuclease family protein [Mucilaginibacter sp. Bleaf8]MBS7565790.1 GIY-YIG nuclease family protein [Mucilaginibacter sp. Bleaf8]